MAMQAISVISTEPPSEGRVTPAPISQETLRGSLYLAGRYGLGVVVSAGNMLVMTWWLGPHAYGLFVTAIGLVAVLAAISRAGVDTFLVRSETDPDLGMYATANAIVLAVSAVLAALGGTLTPLLVRWYGNTEFVFPYVVLLVTIPISGLTGVPMAKLERELDFRKIAAIELLGQSFGLTVAIAMALAGTGVWAPVAGQIAWQSFALVATVLASRLRLTFQCHSEHVRPMVSFGFGITMSLRTWQLRTLVNPLLVGRFAGADAVAFVALAIRIAEALGTLRLAAGRMAIAALARLQEERDRFRSVLEKALFLQIATLGPLLCGFAFAGPILLKHVLGIKWAPSLAVYPFIAAGVLINSVYNLQASALFVLEQHWTVMRSYVFHILLLGGGTWVLFPRCGIAGYGWAELLACCAYYAIHRRLRRTLKISYRKIALLSCGFGITLFLPRIAVLLYTVAIT